MIGQIKNLLIKIKTKKAVKIIFLVLLCFVIAFIFYRRGKSGAVRTQVEEKHETETGGIFLSEEAKQNIGLKTDTADFRTIEEVIKANGILRAKPDKFAIVSTRIKGRVKSVHANVGDKVKKDEDLVDIESLQYGEPPPLVHITAPISGTIVERHVVTGEPVSTEKVLFKIVDLSEIWVEGDILEQDMARIKEGQQVRVMVSAYPDEIFTDRIMYVKDTLDPVTRTGHIWVELKNPQGKLKPEMFADLVIVVGSFEETLTIPEEAVIGGGGSKFVFVEESGRYFKREVGLGLKDDRFIEVTAGLLPGEVVVTQGNHELLQAFTAGGGGAEETGGHAGHAH